MPKQLRTDSIFIEYQGTQIKGSREISGSQILSQKITYKNTTIVDQTPYKPDQVNRDDVMLKFAKQILWQIAAGRVLGA